MSISLFPDNCEYRAEGNAGIVIRLIKEEAVLRLKKGDDVPKQKTIASDDIKELERQIKITRNVLIPFLGESFVKYPVIVFLGAEEVKALNETISKFRPAYRRHKNVEEKDTFVSMLPDYCCLPQNLKSMKTCGPTLSIEIKPKQGFVKEEYLPSSHSFLPIPLCHYCLMKKYKMKTGMTFSKSNYCPTDLFSGCCERMFHALKMLYETPQNNFRLFKDQKLVYSEEKKEDLNDLLSDFFPSKSNCCSDSFCDLIIQVLLKPFPQDMHIHPVSPEKKFSQQCINAYVCSEKDLCHHNLPRNCVLERILSCQLLDNLSISDLYQLYLKVKENKDVNSDYVGYYSRYEIPAFIGELRKTPGESEFQYASRKVWEFLVALCMKDCSIMITFKRLTVRSVDASHSQNIVSDRDGNLFVFSIAIVDLDAKSSDKVEKMHKDVPVFLESYNS